MTFNKSLVFAALLLVLTGCGLSGGAPPVMMPATTEPPNTETPAAQSLIQPAGTVVESRIAPPEGFERTPAEEGSFGAYLRALPLKPDGSPVLLHDGSEKAAAVHAAVVAMDIGSRDLQQCADAVIRLRAEYLYHSGQTDRIAFAFTNGFVAEYRKWKSGQRIRVKGNLAEWVSGGTVSGDYTTFRSYLDTVFAYAGTLSLSKELEPVPAEALQAGDVFIEGGSPGHCVIVVDTAVNEAGEKCFLLAQSYMPAQEIHILKNPANAEGDPWYLLDSQETLVTPQWTFPWSALKRFPQ